MRRLVNSDAASARTAARAPPALPSLRGLKALGFMARFGTNPLIAARDLTDRHGPLVAVHPVLGIPKRGRLTVIASGAAFNQAVLSDTSNWLTGRLPTGGPPGTALDRLGQNIVSMNGPAQTHFRRLIARPLRRDKVEAMGDDIVVLMREEVARWRPGPADLWPLAQELMRNAAVAMLFGGNQRQGTDLAHLIDRMSRESKSVRAYLSRAGLPLGGRRRLLKTAEKVETCASALAHCPHPDGARDLVAVLARAKDEAGSLLSHENLVRHLPILFGASYESCQTVLAWSLMLLAQHPNSALALASEVRGASIGNGITFAKIKDLPWLDAIVSETMRLFPPAPFQTRIAAKDVSLGGYRVPEGAYILLSPFLTCRAKDVFHDPDRFAPERWANFHPTAFQYPVFSAGTRFCPGMWFGVNVVKAALTAIMARFSFSLEPGARIDTQVAITLRPRSGVPAVLNVADDKWSRVPVAGQVTSLVDFPTP